MSGAEWAGAAAALGNLNVYANGSYAAAVPSTYGYEYQCVELAQRWAAIRFGEVPIWPNVPIAADMWNEGPKLPVPFIQLPNGGTTAPQFGDLLVFGATSSFPAGHVAVVSSVDLSAGYVNVVEENYNTTYDPTGQAQLPIDVVNGTYTMPAVYGLPITGWLRSSTAPLGMEGTGGPGGYTLSAHGNVEPFGSSPPVTQTTSWNWNIANAIVATPDGQGGYVLDGYGGVHAFGDAPQVETTGYWPGWDIATGLVLLPDGTSGYVLDGWGGLHPFGTPGHIPPMPTVTGYWPGWSVAVGVVADAAGTGGYVLDAFGGVHPWGLPGDIPPLPKITGYWSGWRIATGITLIPGTLQGYVLDGYNGIHPFGGAPIPISAPYFPGQDIATGIIAIGPGSGYTVLSNGNVEPFGGALPVTFPSSTIQGSNPAPAVGIG